MKTIHLLVVESEMMALFSIGQVIRYFDNYLIVDKLENIDEAIDKLKVVHADLIICGGSENIDRWKELCEYAPAARIILLAQEPSKVFIQDAVGHGVWDIILRPAAPERMRFSLERFRTRFMHEAALEHPVHQERLDSIFYPKERHQSVTNGMIKNTEMLDRVINFIANRETPQSANEIAEVLQVSRITVRKYCEALVNTGKLHIKNKYQSKGRPIKQYFVH
jgi:response regulator of citrate/malate metabolism